jgi:hypothetical protein
VIGARIGRAQIRPGGHGPQWLSENIPVPAQVLAGGIESGLEAGTGCDESSTKVTMPMDLALHSIE